MRQVFDGSESFAFYLRQSSHWNCAGYQKMLDALPHQNEVIISSFLMPVGVVHLGALK